MAISLGMLRFSKSVGMIWGKSVYACLTRIMDALSSDPPDRKSWLRLVKSICESGLIEHGEHTASTLEM